MDKYNQFFSDVSGKIEGAFSKGNRFRGAIMEFGKDLNRRLGEGDFDQRAIEEATYRFSKTFANAKYKD